MNESKKNKNLTRRKFMAVSSAAVAAPFAMKMTGMVPHVEAAEKAAEKLYAGMKSIIIYYSQSGNTRKIGQAIQKGIISQTGQCDLVRVKEITPAELEKYDLIGFGAPTWGSCPSPIIIYFGKSLPATFKSKHFFWYSLHGCSPGRCLIRGVQPLLDAGMTVIGWKDWYGDAALPGHGKPWFTDGHPDAIALAEAELWGKALVMHSRKISEGRTDIIPKLHSKETSDEIWGLGVPQLGMGGPEDGGGRGGDMPAPKIEKKPSRPPKIPNSMEYTCEIEGLPKQSTVGLAVVFGDLYIDPKKCIRCKLCVRGCPTYNIDDSTFPYTFITQQCEGCLFCEGICPTGAIPLIDNYYASNKGNDERKMGDGKVLGGDYGTLLHRAEATGRFRRLIKEEDVGFNTPWEKITKHPRHKEIP